MREKEKAKDTRRAAEVVAEKALAARRAELEEQVKTATAVAERAALASAAVPACVPATAEEAGEKDEDMREWQRGTRVI